MQEPKSIISKEFPQVVIPLIKEAKHSIDIIVFDWRWYKNDPASPVSLFNSAIVDKSHKGVKVRCIVNNEQINDILKSQGFDSIVLDSAKILHTKLIIIDNRIVVIGSHNYTQHAFCSNFELSCCFELENENNDFVKYFNNLFGI